jgi:pyridoxamine 5'-phosphate oxidase
MSIADLRQDYVQGALRESEAAASPFDQFTLWFEQALASHVPEANAMTLATVGADGRPAARIVLLKGQDARGFSFFTNYESRKAEDLAAHPFASLLFFWIPLERQVRIEGRVERVSEAESDEYYAKRPLGSRIGAWASDQSREVANRQVLEVREQEARARFGDAPPRPPHWGGYRLVPDAFEFWQGRSSRLHDRLKYRADGAGGWTIKRLAP